MSECPTWCRLAEGHDDLHQDHVIAMVGETHATIVLTVEAASRAGNPRPVVTAGDDVRVVLDWDELHDLADAMLKAHLRYAPAWGCADMSAIHYADAGPRSIRIYTDDDRPSLVATIRALDSGSVDELLRAYGWKRIGPWVRQDDMPKGHKVAAIRGRKRVHRAMAIAVVVPAYSEERSRAEESAAHSA